MDILPFLRQRAGDYTCPRCRYSLADCGVRILQQRGPLYTVQVTCRRCELSLLVQLEVREDAITPTAAAGEPGARSAGRRTARPRRVALERPAPPISADELLDVHQHLAAFEGPLSSLGAPSVPAGPDRAR